MDINQIRAQSAQPVSLDEVGPDFFDLQLAGDGPCPECGGKGFVHECTRKSTCGFPDIGCDMCEFPCDQCGGQG